MNILGKIIAVKTEEVMEKKRKIPLSELEKQSLSEVRDFKGALEKSGLSVIAEIKRKSPSEGLIREDFDPVAIANAYKENGASTISVLTDSEFFGGSDDYPMLVKQTVDLPVLRKEFIIDSYQILESCVLGADAILLLASVLDASELADFIQQATELGMNCLVEVHDGQELEAALKAGASIIGINNRNLKTFEVSLDISIDLKSRIPEGIVTVSESGIHTHADMERLEESGFDAVLVGTSLMRAEDIGEKLRGLIGIQND
ncbi:indole-3-glycerol phosphate synthase TrpC [candidate division KSB1 bacterium]|nr:indole-3-glycerol phosphate synthase TrpC [candidate division KSB1 bacterium]